MGTIIPEISELILTSVNVDISLDSGYVKQSDAIRVPYFGDLSAFFQI
jgi:hypothetical protein